MERLLEVLAGVEEVTGVDKLAEEVEITDTGVEEVAGDDDDVLKMLDEEALVVE